MHIMYVAAAMPSDPFSEQPATGPLPPAEASDAALVERAARGDYTAFEALVRRYHSRVYSLALGMTKNVMDAEEVTQETFLNMFRHLAAFKQESAPASWIYRIAVNTALMRLRSRRRKPLLTLADHGLASGVLEMATPFWSMSNWARQPDATLISRELWAQLEKALHSLPEKYRLVLVLRDVEGHSSEEVAHSLGLTVPTVKSRLHRARLFVREQLERYFQAK